MNPSTPYLDSFSEGSESQDLRCESEERVHQEKTKSRQVLRPIFLARASSTSSSPMASEAVQCSPFPPQCDMQKLTVDELKRLLYDTFCEHLSMKDIENIIMTEEESHMGNAEECPVDVESKWTSSWGSDHWRGGPETNWPSNSCSSKAPKDASTF